MRNRASRLLARTGELANDQATRLSPRLRERAKSGAAQVKKRATAGKEAIAHGAGSTRSLAKQTVPKVNRAAKVVARSTADAAQTAAPKVAMGARRAGGAATKGAKAAAPKIAAAGKYVYDNPEAVATSLAAVAAAAAVTPGGQPLAVGAAAAAGVAKIVGDARSGKQPKIPTARDSEKK